MGVFINIRKYCKILLFSRIFLNKLYAKLFFIDYFNQNIMEGGIERKHLSVCICWFVVIAIVIFTYFGRRIFASNREAGGGDTDYSQLCALGSIYCRGWLHSFKGFLTVFFPVTYLVNTL